MMQRPPERPAIPRPPTTLKNVTSVRYQPPPPEELGDQSVQLLFLNTLPVAVEACVFADFAAAVFFDPVPATPLLIVPIMVLFVAGAGATSFVVV